MAVSQAELEIDGRHLRLTSLDRVLWPSTGFTKRQMIDYYRAVAPVLLPPAGHLRWAAGRRAWKGAASPRWNVAAIPTG